MFVQKIQVHKRRCTNTIGGLLYTEGNPLGLSLLSQPRILFTSDKININSSGPAAFDLATTIVNIECDSLNYHAVNVPFLFELRDGSITTVTCQDTIAHNLTTSNVKIFRCNGINQGTNLNFRANKAVCNDTFLTGMWNNSIITINIDFTVLSLPGNSPAFSYQGSLYYRGIQLLIFGSPGIATATSLIQQISGDSTWNCDTISYDIENSVLFDISDGNTAVEATKIETSNIDSSMFSKNSSTKLSIEVMSLLCHGGAHCINLHSGITIVDIGEIFTRNTGMAVNLTNSANMNGTISTIDTERGFAINSTSYGDIYLLFNRINTQGGSENNLIGRCLNLNGDGDTWLKGNVINMNFCDVGIHILSPNNSPRLTIDVSNMNISRANNVILIDSLGGELNLSCLKFQCSISHNAAIHVKTLSQVLIKGGGYFLNDGLFFLVENATVLSVMINSLHANRILNLKDTASANITNSTFTSNGGPLFLTEQNSKLILDNNNVQGQTIINAKDSSRVNVNGGDYISFDISFIIENTSTFLANVNYVTSSNVVLSVNTSNTVMYKTISSITNTNNPVINILDSSSTTPHQFGGYMQTYGENVILIGPLTAPQTIRLSASTLVSSSACIKNDVLSNVNVIIEPSIARFDVTGNITKIPPNTLFFDPAII